MTDDLISRQAAIDLFPNDDLEWDTNFGYIAPHFARRMIDELPSAQQWIPCSIKLPKKTDLYYVTIRDEDGTDYTSCMTYCINLARWEVEVNVIAWMPLPNPYEGAKDETD